MPLALVDVSFIVVPLSRPEEDYDALQVYACIGL